MKDFNYDGQYNDVNIDEKDGHLWITLPNMVTLAGFPDEYNLHFMETPKEYGMLNFSTNDEVFTMHGFSFDKVLKLTVPVDGVQDYYGITVGNTIDKVITNHVPDGVTIGSILVRSTKLNTVIAIINLRTVLSLDILRDVRLMFGVELRTAPYSKVSFDDVELSKDIFMSADVYTVPAPESAYREGRVLMSSPEDYQSFLDGLSNSEHWFSEAHSIPHYPMSALIPPPHEIISDTKTFTAILKGQVQMIKGFTGIKTIMIPICPGVNVFMLINQHVEKGVSKPYLDTTNENNMLFQFNIDLLEPIR